VAFSLLREEARRAWRELRGGELSPARGAVAVALGLFIGSQPIFGCHTPLVLILCVWFRLDAALMWVAANISNPLFAPLLLWTEVEIGAYLATGTRLGLRQGISVAEAWAAFPRYMFLGAPLVGIALAVVGAALTYLFLARRARRRARASAAPQVEPYRLPDDAPAWVRAVEQAAARYAPAKSATAAQRTRFHYVRIKLLTDPVARLVADVAGEEPGALGEVMDIGTGAGQLPLLLLDLGRATRARGVDWDASKIEDARRAAAASTPAADADFQRGDAREAELAEADTVLLIDLLHYFRVEEQDRILARAAAAVRPGGRLVVREADTEQGWRSAVTLLEERVFTAIRFNRGERVRFRPSREVVGMLEGLGFRCEVRPAWGKTPFSNVLIVATRPAAG